MPGRPYLADKRDLLKELLLSLEPSEEDQKLFLYVITGGYFPESAVGFINQWLASHSPEEKLQVFEKLSEIYPANRYSLSVSQQRFVQELEQLAEKFDTNNLPYEFSLQKDEESIDYLSTFKSLQANKSIELVSLQITYVETFCLSMQAGIKYIDQAELPQSTKLPAPRNLGKLELNSHSYNKAKGTLHLDPFHEIKFVENGKVKRKDKDGKKGETYEQPRLLECVFKTVNTLEKGVLFSTVLGVHKDIIGKKHQTKIENTVYEINKKAKEQQGVKNLIKILGSKVYLNSSYL